MNIGRAAASAVLACASISLLSATAMAANVAPSGTAIMGLADDITGAGSILHSNGPATTEINDGISGAPGGAVVINGDGTSGATGNGTDTWAGAIPEVGKEFDFVGIEWGTPVNDATQVTVQHFLANDGGWWGPVTTVESGVALAAGDITAPTLQVTTDGSIWTDVPTTNDYVAALTGNVRGTGFPNGTVSGVATFDFAEQDGLLGIRLIENAAGNAATDANGFISAIEFTVEGATTLTLDVDTVTGELVLNSPTGIPGNIIGYDITSAASVGALDPTGWTSIADNYDANSGPTGGVQVDTNDNWTELPGSATSIGEAELNVPSGDGAQFGAGLSMSLGQIWTPNPFGDDLQMELLFDDGTRSNVQISYDGVSSSNPLIVGDFDRSGAVDAADWPTVRDNYNADLAALTPAQSYQMGDMDGNGVVDVVDYGLFKDAFIANQGAAAFAAMVAGQPVPEPSGLALLVIGLATVAGRSRIQKSSCDSNSEGTTTGSRSVKLTTRANVCALACLPILFASSSAMAANIAPSGTAIMGIADDIAGAGAIDHVNGVALTEVNDGISGTPAEAVVINGTGESAAAGNGIDTWAGGIAEVAKEFDWVGIEWASPVTGVDQVRVQHFLANDGGWWGPTTTVDAGQPLTAGDLLAPTLQVTVDGTAWTDVATTNDYVTSLTGNVRGTGFPDAVVSDFATFDFAPQDNILGIRLIGNGAGNAGGDGNGFISTIEFEVEGFVPTLTLEVNRNSGTAVIDNDTGTPFDIDFYSITSDQGVLNTGFTGLSGGGQLPSGTGVGDGWEKLGNLDGNELAEAFLAGSSEINNSNGPFSLGDIYDGSSPADEDSLAFTFRSGGQLVDGNVIFIDSQAGDFDGDGDVDGADFLAWQRVDGTPGGLNDWQQNYGAGTLAASIATVPEPSTGILAAVAAFAALGGRRRRGFRREKIDSTSKVAPRVLGVVAASLALFSMLSVSSAAVTLDRDYQLGDDSVEGAVLGGEVGANFTGPGGRFTADSAVVDTVNFVDAQDIQVLGTPTYADASSRLGASSGALGADFDGVAEYLAAVISLNSPNDYWDNQDFFPNNDYPLNYDGVLGRGIQAWVRPNSGKQGVRQDIVIDTQQHGIYITENDTWGLLFGGRETDTGVSVAYDQWVHVMNVTAAGGGALFLDGSAAGVDQGFYFGEATALTIGANQDGTDNFFQGTLDDVKLFVFGDNSGTTETNNNPAAVGMDYGDFSLAEDNEWIVAQLANLGVTDAADVNLDGTVNGADITAFLPGWKSQNVVGGAQVGDWTSRQNGDLNFDGTVDLGDVFILHNGLLAAGVQGGFPFQALEAVPEPNTMSLIAFGGVAFLQFTRRRFQ